MCESKAPDESGQSNLCVRIIWGDNLQLPPGPSSSPLFLSGTYSGPLPCVFPRWPQSCIFLDSLIAPWHSATGSKIASFSGTVAALPHSSHYQLHAGHCITMQTRQTPHLGFQGVLYTVNWEMMTQGNWPYCERDCMVLPGFRDRLPLR